MKQKHIYHGLIIAILLSLFTYRTVAQIKLSEFEIPKGFEVSGMIKWKKKKVCAFLTSSDAAKVKVWFIDQLGEVYNETEVVKLQKVKDKTLPKGVDSELYPLRIMAADNSIYILEELQYTLSDDYPKGSVFIQKINKDEKLEIAAYEPDKFLKNSNTMGWSVNDNYIVRFLYSKLYLYYPDLKSFQTKEYEYIIPSNSYFGYSPLQYVSGINSKLFLMTHHLESAKDYENLLFHLGEIDPMDGTVRKFRVSMKMPSGKYLSYSGKPNTRHHQYIEQYYNKAALYGDILGRWGHLRFDILQNEIFLIGEYSNRKRKKLHMTTPRSIGFFIGRYDMNGTQKSLEFLEYNSGFLENKGVNGVGKRLERRQIDFSFDPIGKGFEFNILQKALLETMPKTKSSVYMKDGKSEFFTKRVNPREKAYPNLVHLIGRELSGALNDDMNLDDNRYNSIKQSPILSKTVEKIKNEISSKNDNTLNFLLNNFDEKNNLFVYDRSSSKVRVYTVY